MLEKILKDNKQEKFTFLLKSNFYKGKFAKIYMSYKKFAIIFDINTFKLF